MKISTKKSHSTHSSRSQFGFVSTHSDVMVLIEDFLSFVEIAYRNIEPKMKKETIPSMILRIE